MLLVFSWFPILRFRRICWMSKPRFARRSSSSLLFVTWSTLNYTWKILKQVSCCRPWVVHEPFNFPILQGCFPNESNNMCRMCKTNAHVEWLSLRMRWNFKKKKLLALWASCNIEFYLPGAHFLERPSNFLGPKATFKIKTYLIVAQFPTHKPVNFASLIDNYIVSFSNLLKLRS